MRIQFISQLIENVPTAKGSYNKMTVTFKNLDSGKVEVKSNIMDFAAPAVFDRLKEASQNDLFKIELEKKPGKDGKSYWTWTDIARDDGVAPEPVATPKAATAVKGGNTYAENNEINRERLAFDREKQPIIVRQSCIGYAVDLCKDHGKQPDTGKVLQVAQVFYNWVMQNDIAALQEDTIPE